MVWICCASGRSLVAAAICWNSRVLGFSLTPMPTPGEAAAKLSKRLASRVVEPSQKPRKRGAAKEFQAWEAAGLHCSANERRADEASRDVEAWLKCKYMREHLGEEFAGTVSAVTTFGIFVTLDAMYVEGLVHITELGGDYFRFDEARQELRGERSSIRYGIGTRLRVQVSRVDLDGRRIDFRLVRDGEDGLLPPARSGRSGGKDDARGRRDGRETRDERGDTGSTDKWSRRDAKANRGQRNAAAASPESGGAKQGRKASKKAMLKGVNLGALEAEYAQQRAVPKAEPVSAAKNEPAPEVVAPAARQRKSAGKNQVAALLKPEPAAPAAKPARRAKAAPAAKTGKRKAAR